MRSFKCSGIADLNMGSQFCRSVATFCKSRGIAGQDIDEVVQRVVIGCEKWMSKNNALVPDGVVFRIATRSMAHHFAQMKRKHLPTDFCNQELRQVDRPERLQKPSRYQFMRRLRSFRQKSREVYWHWLVINESDADIMNKFHISSSALGSMKQRLKEKFGMVCRRSTTTKLSEDFERTNAEQNRG